MNEPRYRDAPLPATYPSRVDLWLGILLIFPPIVIILLTLYAFWDGNSDDGWILLGTSCLIVAVTAIFTCPCRYTIDDDQLRIRCGIIGYAVPLREIRSIETSGSWMSAPALSVRRVRIATKRREYLISPAARDEFMERLRAEAIRAGCTLEDTQSG